MKRALNERQRAAARLMQESYADMRAAVKRKPGSTSRGPPVPPDR